jgi:nucleotide-binding universal stress UspA family protein
MNAQTYQPQPIKRVTTRPHHKFLSILIADDGSPDILAAVDLLNHMPITNCSITALTVLTAREGDSYAVREACLEQTKELFQKKNLPVRTILEGGDPAEVILAYAKELTPSLVVMGANGLRHIFGVPLGGVVEKVAEQIRTPILIMRHPYQGLQRIGLFTDGSSQAEYATQFLAELPWPEEVEIHAVHVEQPPSYAEIIASSWSQEGATGNGKVAEKTISGEAILKKAVMILQDRELRVKSELLSGDPCDQISLYLQKERIDLAVVGARGFTKGKSWELGSLPRKMLHYCPCPTLIVKDRRDWSTRN